MARRIREPTRDTLPPSRRPNNTTHFLGSGPASTEVCYFCYCDPCISNQAHLPECIKGASPDNPGNAAKRYRMYRELWTYLRKLGLWDFAPYKERKRVTGHGRSSQDIIPECIKQVCLEPVTTTPHHCIL